MLPRWVHARLRDDGRPEILGYLRAATQADALKLAGPLGPREFVASAVALPTMGVLPVDEPPPMDRRRWRGGAR